MTGISTTRDNLMEFQNELCKIQSTLKDVVSALTFLQGFIESEYGMRFQFQAYKASSPSNEQLSNVIRGLQAKYSDRTDRQQKHGPVTITIVSAPSSTRDSDNHPDHLPESNAVHSHQDDYDSSEMSTELNKETKNEPSLDVANANDSSNHNDDFCEPDPDPDYILSNLADSPSEPSRNTFQETEEYLCEKSGKTKIRKRRKCLDRSKWQRIMMSRARERGEAYMGTTIIERENGRKQNMNAKPRPPRKMGKPCESPSCNKTNLRQCSRFTEADRKQIFNSFWKEKNWEEKKMFVSGLTERVFPKQPKMDLIGRRRGETINYYLPLGKSRLRVCKAMFMSTVGIRVRQLHCWIKRVAAAPDESKRPVVKMKTYQKRGKEEKAKILKDGGFKCPYCLKIMGTRVEFTKHMANHMEQFSWNGGNEMNKSVSMNSPVK